MRHAEQAVRHALAAGGAPAVEAGAEPRRERAAEHRDLARGQGSRGGGAARVGGALEAGAQREAPDVVGLPGCVERAVRVGDGGRSLFPCAVALAALDDHGLASGAAERAADVHRPAEQDRVLGG